MTAPTSIQLRIIAEVMEAVQKIVGDKADVSVEVAHYGDWDVSVVWDWKKEEKK